MKCDYCNYESKDFTKLLWHNLENHLEDLKPTDKEKELLEFASKVKRRKDSKDIQ